MRLVSTLGWSPNVVLYPLRVLKPDEAVVIYGSVGKEDALKTREAIQRIREESPVGDLKFVEVEPLSLKDTIEKIEDRVRITDDTIVNITGGTKVMSFALALLATMRKGGEVPIIYVVTERHSGGDAMRIKRIPLMISGTRVNFKKNGAPAMILRVLAENDGAEMSNGDLQDEVNKRLKELGIRDDDLSEGAFTDAKKPLLCLNLISERGEGKNKYYTLNSSAWFFVKDFLDGGDAE